MVYGICNAVEALKERYEDRAQKNSDYITGPS